MDLGHSLDHPVEVLGVRRAPRGDRALVDRLLGIGHDQLGVDLECRAEAVTGSARPVRGVEREVAWGELFVARSADRAGEVLTERELILDLTILAHDLDLGDALGELERGLEAVGESPLDALAPHQPVDDHLDRVILVTGQRFVALQEIVDVDDLTVDAGADEALTGKIFEQRLVLALAPAHHRCQHLEARPLLHQQDPVDDLRRRLALQAGAVVGAVLDPDSRIQQAEVVVDLGDRADGRTRVATRRLLVDRDRRGQTLDDIDVGLVHLAEELPRVCAERFDVAPLALCVDGVERQARLAGTGQSCENDELVAWEIDADIPQIVLACAANDDLVSHFANLPGREWSGVSPRRAVRDGGR